MNTQTNDQNRWEFLGESAWSWMLFIAAVTVWLIVWGRIVTFLGSGE